MPGLCRHLGEVSSSGRCGPVLGSAVRPPGHLTLGHQPTQNRFRRARSRDAALASHWSAGGVRRPDWWGGHTGQPSLAGLSWAQSVAGPVAERSGLHSDELSEHWL